MEERNREPLRGQVPDEPIAITRDPAGGADDAAARAEQMLESFADHRGGHTEKDNRVPMAHPDTRKPLERT